MKRNLLTLVVTILLGASLANAQATRTWVSGVGDDANPCSRTAPCKTFAGAISKTAVGGEIDALDPGGYGAVTITKSITLDGGGGQVASILVSGTNGIVVAAGVNDVVTIRNLRINGITTGLAGIRFASGKALVIQNCEIFEFGGNGIEIVAAGGKVFVDGTTSRNNGGSGLAVATTALTTVSINNSQFELNGSFGVIASNFSQVAASNSVANGNGSVGFIASASGGTAELNLLNCTAANNGTGIQAGTGTAPAIVRVSGVAVYGSGAGFVTGGGGTIKSFGNNFNSGSGAPTPPNLPVQ
jgi:Right handed beta helix region